MKVYVIAMALIGGAVLARYMLPAVPLVIIVGSVDAAQAVAILAGSGGGCGDRFRGRVVLESAVRIFAGR